MLINATISWFLIKKIISGNLTFIQECRLLHISKILPMRRNLSLRHKNRKSPMKSLDSREVTNEITGFLYL
jgi:hypothetical protein